MYDLDNPVFNGLSFDLPSFFPFLPPSHFPSPSPICFPPQFGFFPYPYPPPPLLPLPSPSPPPQGANQALPKQLILVPAPLTIPSSPSIETSQNIPSKSQSSVVGGSKKLFHIDAKLFSFSFDGGRFDSYAIHETRRNVKSSIWVGRRGMEWILTCLDDIRDWVAGHVLLCKRFRDNGKLLEFCGRSNKAGLFVVIAVYFGGSRRRCIMIPASSNRAGWSLFQKELRNFCFGAKLVSLAKVSLNNGGGGGQLAGGGRSGKSMSIYGNQQKIRNFEKNGTK